MSDIRISAEQASVLVGRARDGDAGAWDGLVAAYSGVIWAVTRGFRLSASDGHDVVQTTWLRLLEHLDRINDPARVGAWLATTARRECLRTLALSKRTTLAGDQTHLLDGVDTRLPEAEAALIAAERAADVRTALAQLPRRWQQLLTMLNSDPAPSYQEISRDLRVPIGSIGPTRGRALRRLAEVLDPEVFTPLASAS